MNTGPFSTVGGCTYCMRVLCLTRPGRKWCSPLDLEGTKPLLKKTAQKECVSQKLKKSQKKPTFIGFDMKKTITVYLSP